ncbi:hypothetical protein L7F22_017985 [Adiantum nelumboides]|nr:hypothetical protein [Adiantum nelumboides]
MSQRRGCHSAPSANEEAEDVKVGSVNDRRVLRSHYRHLKASIAEGKEHLLSADSRRFDEIVRRADDLYTLVHRPREQIADAEALLDITEAFLNSVKDSRQGNAVKAGDLVSTIIKNFRQPANLDDTEITILDWNALGSEATCIFHDAPGLQTMLGPMESEPKKRKAAASRRRERGPAAETARPETVGDEEGEKQSQTDKFIRTMFNILRRCGERGCELEQLVLSRDSFSQTVENIFSLSFLVKDGRAQINIQDGKQFVAFKYAPTAAERAGRPQGGEEQQIINSQFVFRFDFKDWILMKEMVEQGTEQMPQRKQQAMPSQTPSTPIRKNSRNRGRTSSASCELTIELGTCEDENEGQDNNDENNGLSRSKPPMKRRMLI